MALNSLYSEFVVVSRTQIPLDAIRNLTSFLDESSEQAQVFSKQQSSAGMSILQKAPYVNWTSGFFRSIGFRYEIGGVYYRRIQEVPGDGNSRANMVGSSPPFLRHGDTTMILEDRSAR